MENRIGFTYRHIVLIDFYYYNLLIFLLHVFLHYLVNRANV